MTKTEMAKYADKIEAEWGKFRGRRELLKHLRGEPITLKQQITARCYDCCAGYDGGAVDCNIPSCPLYSSMPYGKERGVSKRTMTPENRAATIERFRKLREAKKEAV
jgi:hypothetical protein